MGEITREIDPQLENQVKSIGNITLTEHIAKFCGNVAKIVRVCKHTNLTAPTDRKQVLQILELIVTMDTLLQAHVYNINGDPLVSLNTVMVWSLDMCGIQGFIDSSILVVTIVYV